MLNQHEQLKLPWQLDDWQLSVDHEPVWLVLADELAVVDGGDEDLVQIHLLSPAGVHTGH